MKNSVRVAVADSNTFVRAGVKLIAEACSDFSFIGEATNKEQAIRINSNKRPDVLIVGTDLPGGCAELALEMSSKRITSRILVVGKSPSKSFFKEMLTYGVSGFLPKEADQHTIVSVVRKIAKGNFVFICGESTSVAKDEVQIRNLDGRLSALTKRESEVLLHIGKGTSNKKIADSLSISPSTVKNHITRIYDKLEVDSRAGLIHWSIKNQIQSPRK